MKRGALLVLLIAIVAIGYFTVTKLGGPAGASVVNTTDQASKEDENPSVSDNSAKKAVGEQIVSDLTFTDIDGNVVKVDPNKKTILHFIVTTGCTSCAASEAKLTKFANNPNVNLVSIAIDPQNDTKETTKEFMKIAKANWPYTIDKDQLLIRKFNVTSIDTVVIVYQNKIIFSGVNPSPAELEKLLI